MGESSGGAYHESVALDLREAAAVELVLPGDLRPHVLLCWQLCNALQHAQATAQLSVLLTASLLSLRIHRRPVPYTGDQHAEGWRLPWRSWASSSLALHSRRPLCGQSRQRGTVWTSAGDRVTLLPADGQVMLASSQRQGEVQSSADVKRVLKRVPPG